MLNSQFRILIRGLAAGGTSGFSDWNSELRIKRKSDLGEVDPDSRLIDSHRSSSTVLK